jgi:hypothetical protein
MDTKMTEETMRMLQAEQNRFNEMNEYIENFEQHIRRFKNSGTTVKIEIMNQMLYDAQSFIDYYTDE